MPWIQAMLFESPAKDASRFSRENRPFPQRADRLALAATKLSGSVHPVINAIGNLHRMTFSEGEMNSVFAVGDVLDIRAMLPLRLEIDQQAAGFPVFAQVI